jgi:hypothetical protein
MAIRAHTVASANFLGEAILEFENVEPIVLIYQVWCSQIVIQNGFPWYRLQPFIDIHIGFWPHDKMV